MGFIISAFALPIVMARSASVSYIKTMKWYAKLNELYVSLLQIAYSAAYLTLGGNLIIFATIFIFFVLAEQEESTYGGGF